MGHTHLVLRFAFIIYSHYFFTVYFYLVIEIFSFICLCRRYSYILYFSNIKYQNHLGKVVSKITLNFVIVTHNLVLKQSMATFYYPVSRLSNHPSSVWFLRTLHRQQVLKIINNWFLSKGIPIMILYTLSVFPSKPCHDYFQMTQVSNHKV